MILVRFTHKRCPNKFSMTIGCHYCHPNDEKQYSFEILRKKLCVAVREDNAFLWVTFQSKKRGMKREKELDSGTDPE